MKKLFSSLLVALLGFTLIACDDVVKEENEIKVYTRDTTSGTRGAFFEIVDLDDLAGSNEGLAQGFVEVESNGSMMNSVKNDEFGIGYISLSGLAESGLKGLAFNGVEATEANVLSDAYSLKRPFMYVRKAEENIENEDEKALLNAFLAFMDSKEGKEVILNNSGIVAGVEDAPTWTSLALDHPIVESTGDDVEIHFGGSTSVESIGRALSEAFSTIAPRFSPVHAHAGSGAAFSGTREDGNFHIGFASRNLNATELAGLNEGEFGRLAWDAVVIVVNNTNELNNVTTKQVQDIFTGEITLWNDLVEEEVNKIMAYTRDTTSGTRGAFFEIIGLNNLGSSNNGIVTGYVEVESNGSMMNSVRNDEFGIGYISLSGLAESGLKGLAFNGVEATEANVLNDTYTLKRPFMYIRKADQLITNEDEKALVNAFLAFMETNDGKAIIANEGGIAEGLDEAPTWASIAADHPVVESTGAPIEIHFGGSTSVESIGRALSAAFSTIAPRFNPVHAHAGSGAAFSGTREDGNFHLGFASRNLNATELAGLNDGEFGRLSWDAVVIVVNNLNTLNNITTEEIQKVYTGVIVNWQNLLS